MGTTITANITTTITIITSAIGVMGDEPAEAWLEGVPLIQASVRARGAVQRCVAQWRDAGNARHASNARIKRSRIQRNNAAERVASDIHAGRINSRVAPATVHVAEGDAIRVVPRLVGGNGADSRGDISDKPAKQTPFRVCRAVVEVSLVVDAKPKGGLVVREHNVPRPCECGVQRLRGVRVVFNIPALVCLCVNMVRLCRV